MAFFHKLAFGTWKHGTSTYVLFIHDTEKTAVAGLFKVLTPLHTLDALKTQVACFNCGEMGHICCKGDCSCGSTRSLCAHRPLESDDSDKEAFFSSSSSQEWIVASGASKHMTPLRDGLQHCQEKKGNCSLPIRHLFKFMTLAISTLF